MNFSTNLSKEIENDLNGLNGTVGKLRIYGFATVVSMFYLARRSDQGDEYKYDEAIDMLFNLATPFSKSTNKSSTTTTPSINKSFTKTSELLKKLHKLEDLEPSITRYNGSSLRQFGWNKEYISKVYKLLTEYDHPFATKIGNTIKPENLCSYYNFEFQTYYQGQMSAMAWIWLHTMSFFVEFRLREPIAVAITNDNKIGDSESEARQTFRLGVIKTIGLFIPCSECQDHYFTNMLRRQQDDLLVDYRTLCEKFIILHELIQKKHNLQQLTKNIKKPDQSENWFQFWFSFSENLHHF